MKLENITEKIRIHFYISFVYVYLQLLEKVYEIFLGIPFSIAFLRSLSENMKRMELFE